MSILDALFDGSAENQMAKKLGISKQDVLDLFNEFDTDGSGSIDSTELQSFLAYVGVFWEAEMVEEALKMMDADGNGTVDLKEFATWFVRDMAGHGWCTEPANTLRVQLLGKVAARQISKAMKGVKGGRPGKDCKNQGGLSAGSITDETKQDAPCSYKVFICGSSSVEFAALNPPETAKAAGYIDLTLREGVTSCDIAAIIEGISMVYEAFGAPMVEMIPRAPNVPGMKEAKVYDSYRVEKVQLEDCSVLRVIAFSELDPQSITHGSEVELGEYIPSLHAAYYGGCTLHSLFQKENGFKLSQLCDGRIEYNFTWNTKTVAAIRALHSTKAAKDFLDLLPGNEFSRNTSLLAFNVFQRTFASQSSSFEVAFNGYQDLAEAMVQEWAIPSVSSRGWPYDPWKKPSEEEVSAIIAAVGKIGGKTFKSIRDDLQGMGPVFPADLIMGFLGTNPRTRGHKLGSILSGVKEALQMVPEDFAPYKELGLKIYGAISGVKGAKFASEVFKGGMETKGLEFLELLPTEEEIMASETMDIPTGGAPPDNMLHLSERFLAPENAHFRANFFLRFLFQEAHAAYASGKWQGSAFDPLRGAPQDDIHIHKLKEMMKDCSITEQELATFLDNYSEIFDVLKVFYPIFFKDFEILGADEPTTEALHYARGRAVHLFKLE